MNPVTLVGRPLSGSVEAEAFVLDVTWLGSTAAQARALTLLAQHPGARVHQVGDALVVLAAAQVHVRAAPGTPLVRQGPFLASITLTARDRERLAEHGIEACWVRGGIAEPLSLSSETRLDVGQWIGTDEWTLGAPPPAPADAQPAIDPDVRHALNVAPASEELAEVKRALEDRAAGRGLVTLGKALGALAAITSVAAVLSGALVIPILSSLGSLFGSRSGSGASAAGSGAGGRRASGAAGAGPAEESLLQRMERALRDWIARSRLGALVGHQHARYLERMLEMFDEGRLDDALRHAIPLAGEGGAPAQAALAPPRPRENLAIELQRALGPGTSIVGSAALYDHLRQRYRRAFDQLVQRGEIEKAAFVLIELLGAHEEAVSFLERHGRMRLAAELAEAKDLPPGLQIRQWFLARDVPRALAIARRTGAFADAVLRLSRDHAAAAEALRIAWADSLAESGALSAAVDVLWPLERCRAIALQWIERGIAVGGPAGARMLARKASQVPSAVMSVREALDRMLEAEPERAAATLIAFADHLAPTDRLTPTGRSVALLSRSAWRDAMRLRSTADGALSAGQSAALDRIGMQLLDKAGDALLTHEASALARPAPLTAQPLSHRPTARQHRWAASDRAALVARDAMRLPDGRVLVALGEAGALLMRADGSVQARFSQPADAFVASHHGDRAILVASRGEATRLARLDLISRRCEPWCDARLTAWAPTFDGETWYVASDATVFGIDATRDGWSHRFRVSNDEAAFVAAMWCDEEALAVQFELPAQVWGYQLPRQKLTHRVLMQEDAVYCVASTRAVLECTDNDEGRVIHLRSLRALSAGQVVALNDAWAICIRPDEAGSVVLALDTRSLTPRLELHLEGASRPRVRLEDEHLIVTDELGRVIVVSLATGAILHDLRPAP